MQRLGQHPWASVTCRAAIPSTIDGHRVPDWSWSPDIDALAGGLVLGGLLIGVLFWCLRNQHRHPVPPAIWAPDDKDARLKSK
jgi:hypothetical protein